MKTFKTDNSCGKKSPRDILEAPKVVKSSCSLRVKRSEFPLINEGRRRKRDGKSERNDSSDESQRESYWLKPGISLPKMRDSRNAKPVSPATPSSKSSNYEITSSTIGTEPVSSFYIGECFLKDKATVEELTEKTMGPSECQSSFEVANSDINNHTIFMDDPVSEESKALKNWAAWMSIRRKQNKRFSEKLNRDKCRLVMNAAENVRQMREENDLLSYARIETPDKWRGNPNFWKEPAMLARRGMRSKYYAYKTMNERGIIPTLEFVAVPDAVKIEKDVFCNDQSSRNTWNTSDYREKLKKKYAKYLEKVAPHKVEAEDLVILGEKIKPDDKNTCPEEIVVPLIRITPPDEVASSTAEDSATIIVINGTEIRMQENESDERDSYMWSLIFETVHTGIITENTLFVENKGTVAIRYQWFYKSPDKQSVLPKRKATVSDPCFFFDRNPGIILPGQKLEMKFYHYSKIPGYHSETWCLRLKPSLFENGYVRLTAIAENRNKMEDFLKMDSYLDSCVTSNVVKQIVDEIFDRAKPEPPRPIEYRSLFMEEELFEFQNPAHYYRYDFVEELKSLFKQVPLDESEEWDLNLFTLEGLIRAYVAGQSQRTMLCRFTEISRILLRPGPERYKLNKKHKMIYNAICGVMDSMETCVERLRDDFTMLDTLYDDSEPEDETILSDSLKSVRSRTSEVTSLDNYEEEGLQVKSIPKQSAFRISCENMYYYRYAVYMTIFNYLCEAAEQAAGIIESCRLFEHHGEVITAENINFIFEQ